MERALCLANDTHCHRFDSRPRRWVREDACQICSCFLRLPIGTMQQMQHASLVSSSAGSCEHRHLVRRLTSHVRRAA